MTSSNGNIFHVTGHLRREFTGPRWNPRTKASDAELRFFFDQRLNKRLSKQSQGWWFETLARPFWRHCNYNGMHCRRSVWCAMTMSGGWSWCNTPGLIKHWSRSCKFSLNCWFDWPQIWREDIEGLPRPNAPYRDSLIFGNKTTVICRPLWLHHQRWTYIHWYLVCNGIHLKMSFAKRQPCLGLNIISVIVNAALGIDPLNEVIRQMEWWVNMHQSYCFHFLPSWC